jgi:hypothetical protein
MAPVSIFSLRPSEDERKGSLLQVAGAEIGLVRGTTIEAQYSCTPGFIVIASWDIPYEEELTISLRAKASFKLLDEIVLGLPYTPGVFERAEVCSANTLQFSFFGEDQWRLDVLERPRTIWLKNYFGAVRYTRRLPGMHFLRLRRVI